MFSQGELNGINFNGFLLLSYIIIFNIHNIYFHAAFTSGLENFEENPISRWIVELVSRKDPKNLIQRALDSIIFVFGFN